MNTSTKAANFVLEQRNVDMKKEIQKYRTECLQPVPP